MRAHRFVERINSAEFALPYGHVRRIAAGLVEATGPASVLGELCEIACGGQDGSAGSVLAEVAAVDEHGVALVPLDQHATIPLDARVRARATRDRVPVGAGFAGRALDPLGRPMDGGAQITADAFCALGGTVPAPLERADPARILPTGMRAIDGLLTIGRGQRIGIFAASGVGKTSLIEQLAVQVETDHCIICLVGERGREVEAIWRMLSKRPDSGRYTIVAATSDQSAALRARSVNYALCLADHWRSEGKHVLLVVDSVTRLAMALREMGLAAGAPPTVRGYTPNVFSALPRVVERCGAVRSGGAITAIMTVLSESDDVDDPIVELMKSLLDGHIVLSRALAEQGHFPAIDIARSISRGSERLVAPGQAKAMREAVAMLASYEEARVMIETGVYKAGSNPGVDRAIAARGELNAFLRQKPGENMAFADVVSSLTAITGRKPDHA